MKVKFVPQNVEYEIRPGQSVLDLAQEKGVHIRTSCNGLPSCAECRIRVVEGDYNVTPPTTKELNLIGTGYFLDQRRLSCQLTCFGDVTIDTSEHVGKEGEGVVTKQFLQRVHKTSAEETHSVNGVLIEQDAELLNNVEAREVEEPVQRSQQHQHQHHKSNQQNRQQQGQQKQHQGGGHQRQGQGGGGQGHNQQGQGKKHNHKRHHNHKNKGGGGGPRPQGNSPRPQNSPNQVQASGSNASAANRNDGGGSKPNQ